MRIGPRPVCAGKIGDLAWLEVVPVCIVEMVAHCHARLRDRERIGRKDGIRDIETPGMGRICASREASGIDARGSKDCIQGIVGAIAKGEPVGARLEDKGARRAVRIRLCPVIACKVLEIDLDRHGLMATRLDDGGLREAQKLDGRLLDASRHIRCLSIDLDDRAALRRPGVCDIDRDGKAHLGAALLALRDRKLRLACKCLHERRVGKAVAEAIGDLGGVVPAVFEDRGASSRGGIALSEHGVGVARLIVAVASIDAFCLDHIVGRGIGHTARTGQDILCIRIAVAAHVLHGRSAHVVRCHDVGKAARRALAANQDICDAQKTIAAREADREDGRDSLIVGKLSDLHRVGGVQQHDNVLGALLGHLDRGTLVVGQGKRLFGTGPFGYAARQIVDILGARTSQDDDGCIGVLAEAVTEARRCLFELVL